MIGFAPDNRALFRNCVAASAVLHAALFLGAHGASLWRPSLPVEIDLTLAPGTGPAKLGAPKKSSPVSAPGPTDLPAVAPPEDPVKAPVAPPKDWVLSGPETKEIEKPAPPLPTPGGTPDGVGTASKLGGEGIGSDSGVPGGTGTGGGGTVDVGPRLLNRDEVIANLRRFYPESERRAGREGRVVVAIHIGADGRVSSVDILQSGGTAFDEASKQVARLMLFSPARKANASVAVKMPQTMVFQLQD